MSLLDGHLVLTLGGMADRPLARYFASLGATVAPFDAARLGEASFLIDDLGAEVDWTIGVVYRVTTVEKTVYDSEKITRRRTPKRGDPSITMNESVRLNIEEVISDPVFLKAIGDG